VIVVTDRVVLDQQLQDTIYQFEHKRGVVQRIDDSSRQLAEALENAVPVIITTLQKFPWVSRQLLKMAEQRGTNPTDTLPTRRCAVIIDEAHSSQGGEAATDLKEVLGGEGLKEEARKRAAEEGRENLEELFRSMAKRGRQANLSFFAFTATPKHKTLAVFGRQGQPAHRYTMRQAIEEEFILDVLEHYTTYATYFKLLKACEDDPNVERKKAAQALARFMRLHPHNIAQTSRRRPRSLSSTSSPSPGTRSAVEPRRWWSRARACDKFELVFKNLLERIFVERMDQNEEIFVRYMNDVPFQKIVTTWMASEAYRRLRSETGGVERERTSRVLPTRLRIVEPRPEERYVSCVPLVPLEAAAGAFGDPQHVEDDGFEWVAVDSRHRLRPGMFVALVADKQDLRVVAELIEVLGTEARR